jgi:hypothetical protein
VRLRDGLIETDEVNHAVTQPAVNSLIH